MSQQPLQKGTGNFYNKLKNITTTPGRIVKPPKKNNSKTQVSPGPLVNEIPSFKPTKSFQLAKSTNLTNSSLHKRINSATRTTPDFNASAASEQTYNSSLLNDSLLNDDNEQNNDKIKSFIENSFEKFQLQIETMLEEKFENQAQSLKAQLAKFNNSVDQIKESQQLILEQLKQYGSKENVIVPSELKKKMKNLYRKLPDAEKWDLDEVFTSSINESLTDQFVSDAKIHLEKYTEEQIRKSCQIYFTNLRKEDRLKEDVERHEEITLQKKYRVRRVRLYVSRSKFVKESESSLWANVTQELMSDEEDAGNAFKVKSPPWRSTDLSKLVVKLDKRKEAKDSESNALIPKVKRVAAESPMKRLPSKKVKLDLIKGNVDNEEEEPSTQQEELYEFE